MPQIRQFTVSRDPAIYECHPDLACGCDGRRLVAVFTERTHHWLDRSYSRIVCCVSDDRGQTWSPKRNLTESSSGRGFFFDAPRIANLGDGRLCVLAPRIPLDGGERAVSAPMQWLFSRDNGETWSERTDLPISGIAPDKPAILPGGRIAISAHRYVDDFLAQFMIWSGDGGATWSDPVMVAGAPGVNYCEASILPLSDGRTLVAFMRENSGRGEPCKRAVSRDLGETWEPMADFPLPGCMRPVVGRLADGRLLMLWTMHTPGIARRMTLGTLFTEADALASAPRGLATFQLDYDRSPFADTGYTGWVQFPDGEICAVNYIADDAGDCAQIRGYSLRVEEAAMLPLARSYTRGMTGT